MSSESSLKHTTAFCLSIVAHQIPFQRDYLASPSRRLPLFDSSFVPDPDSADPHQMRKQKGIFHYSNVSWILFNTLQQGHFCNVSFRTSGCCWYRNLRQVAHHCDNAIKCTTWILSVTMGSNCKTNVLPIIQTFPVDLLVEISLLSVSARLPLIIHVSAEPPTSWCRVCKSWREVALGLSRLWTAICGDINVIPDGFGEIKSL